jgi:hypothetical protein
MNYGIPDLLAKIQRIAEPLIGVEIRTEIPEHAEFITEMVYYTGLLLEAIEKEKQTHPLYPPEDRN